MTARNFFSSRALLRAMPGILVAVASCATLPPSTDRSRLENTEWVVVRLAGRDMKKEAQISLSFSSNDTVSGVSGCGEYSAKVQIEANVIGFGPVAAVDRNCSARSLAVQQVYFENLKKVQIWDIRSENLRLQNGDGTTVIRLEKRNPQPDG